MGAETAISWTDSTFNTHWGCTKISEACRDCYAEKWALRTGKKLWGPTAPRRFFGDKHWREPLKWNRAAAAAGKPWRVFCSSMADVFEELPEGHPDRDAMAAARTRLWRLIEATPALTWLLLTKRPENIVNLGPAAWWAPPGTPPANVWLGTTVENQETAALRLSHLLSVPAVVHFVSAEPLLERIDLRPYLHCSKCGGTGIHEEDHGNGAVEQLGCPGCMGGSEHFLKWVIVGGESGGKARPFELGWARSLRDQCAEAKVAFLMKQLGDNPFPATKAGHHGADVALFPADLRIQQFPIARSA